jgi:hypothetical protein
MTALAQFNTNIVAADRLVAMYRELRVSRKLGARGQLDAANQDLLWLPRSAVVASISALDTYVHGVVYDRLPGLLGHADPLPDPLCDQLSQLVPIRNATTFRDALPLLVAANTAAQLIDRLKDKYLRFQSFQAPEKLIEAYRLLGFDAVFEGVANLWPGPNTTADHIRQRLAGYVRRRNQIAHEGDIEANGQPRPMQPEYAVNCREFVAGLVGRLNQVAYGV